MEQGHDDHHFVPCTPGLADAFSCGGDEVMFFPCLAEAATSAETAEERYGRSVHGRDPLDCCRSQPMETGIMGKGNPSYPKSTTLIRNRGYDYRVEAGMVSCVEALVRLEDGDFFKRLDEQVTVTDDG